MPNLNNLKLQLHIGKKFVLNVKLHSGAYTETSGLHKYQDGLNQGLAHNGPKVGVLENFPSKITALTEKVH